MRKEIAVVVCLTELSVETRKGLAKECSSPDVLTILAEDSDKIVRAEIALNPALSDVDQIKLAKDTYKTVRRNLAKRPNLCLQSQEILAKDKDERVLVSLVRNPDTYPSIRDALAFKESTPFIAKLAIAGTPLSSKLTLDYLANSAMKLGILEILAEVVANPITDPETVDTIINSVDNDYVWRSAMNRQRETKNLFDSTVKKLESRETPYKTYGVYL